MDRDLQNRALNFSIIDGGLSAVMGSLAGGIFLMGFALKILKAEPQQIGILASLFLTNYSPVVIRIASSRVVRPCLTFNKASSRKTCIPLFFIAYSFISSRDPFFTISLRM